jgi:hypothetical protein
MELVEFVEGRELAAQWQFATSQFLVSEPDWPGGDENKQRVLEWIFEHSLEDALDKVTVLRLAFSELKSAGKIVNEKGDEGWTH